MADARYASWIRQQDCALCLGPPPCHAHHHTEGLTYDPEGPRPPKALGGKRGKSQKADDTFLIPLHLRCHKHVHEFTGPCSDWTQERRRAWQDAQVKAHRARYAMTAPEPIAPVAATAVAARKASGVPRDIAQKERDRVVRVIRARAAERQHLPDQHQLLAELADDIASGLNDVGAF